MAVKMKTVLKVGAGIVATAAIGALAYYHGDKVIEVAGKAADAVKNLFTKAAETAPEAPQEG